MVRAAALVVFPGVAVLPASARSPGSAGPPACARSSLLVQSVALALSDAFAPDVFGRWDARPSRSGERPPGRRPPGSVRDGARHPITAGPIPVRAPAAAPPRAPSRASVGPADDATGPTWFSRRDSLGGD